MTVSKKGFTLIELLVVILIIGILAAVALPQYNRAVWKSRFIQAKTLARNIANSEEVYYTANNEYTNNFEHLDIDLPVKSYNDAKNIAYFDWGNCQLSTHGNRQEVHCVIEKNGTNYLRYVLEFFYGSYWGSKAICVAYGVGDKPKPSDINYKVCKEETQDPSAEGFSPETLYWGYNQ